MQRLGKNLNGYLGEKIDIHAVLSDCVAAARTFVWKIDELPTGSKLNLLAFTRSQALVASKSDEDGSRGTNNVSRLYISAGIHGDEPACLLAIRQLLQENHWPLHLDIWICPCLNPTGFIHHRRENADGLDLNRQYLEPKAEETLVHISWLNRQPNFDLCLCLHEDWESHGFYIYEVNPENRVSVAETIVKAVAQVCPIDTSEIIEGWDATNGIIQPGHDPKARPQWPEAFYLLTHRSRHTCTLEAPSDFPLATRVAALVSAVQAAVRYLDSA